MMPLPGLPYPDHSPFNKPGTESKFAQRDYSEGMNQGGVNGDHLAPGGMPPFANGEDCRKTYVPPRAGAPGPQ